MPKLAKPDAFVEHVDAQSCWSWQLGHFYWKFKIENFQCLCFWLQQERTPMPTPPALLNPRLETALEACWAAGKITLAHYQSQVHVDIKDDGSPVTQADLRAEQEIRRILGKHFPEDALVGEEGGARPSSTAKAAGAGTWYIDPIDGTKSFICGVPFYAVLLAYEIAGEVVLGVVNLPALNEMIWASKGGGCFWNGRPARVSRVSELRDARLMLTDYRQTEKDCPASGLHQLCAETRLQRTWGDAYGHVLVATGRAEIMIDPRMSVWDCGPLLPILQEAGGRFTDWQGNETIHGPNAFSTNGLLHEAVRAKLNQA
jgi:histidinol phosphatase-like enzyme (inositol monophosphatase family)